MNAIARKQNEIITADHSDAIRNALKSSLYPGASDASVDMVLSYCQAAGLDPMTKPVHIVPMQVSTGKKDGNGWDIKESRDVVMPGIGLYRILAARTGQYVGCSEPEFGPIKTLATVRETWENGPNNKRVKKSVDATMEYPEWCRVTVRRLVGGHIAEFTARELWLENYASKNGGVPNAMWEKRAFGQLAKCAEAQALRKAFPEFGAQPTAEEMDGKSFEVDDMPRAEQPLAMPQSKAITGSNVIDGEFTEKPAEQPAEQKAENPPGIYVGPGPLRLLLAKGKAAGYGSEEALVERFGAITQDRMNDVLRELGEIAAKANAS